jgi:hypothetical protein
LKPSLCGSVVDAFTLSSSILGGQLEPSWCGVCGVAGELEPS